MTIFTPDFLMVQIIKMRINQNVIEIFSEKWQNCVTQVEGFLMKPIECSQKA
jgi:hypothetical protein